MPRFLSCPISPRLPPRSTQPNPVLNKPVHYCFSLSNPRAEPRPSINQPSEQADRHTHLGEDDTAKKATRTLLLGGLTAHTPTRVRSRPRLSTPSAGISCICRHENRPSLTHQVYRAPRAHTHPPLTHSHTHILTHSHSLTPTTLTWSLSHTPQATRLRYVAKT